MELETAYYRVKGKFMRRLRMWLHEVMLIPTLSYGSKILEWVKILNSMKGVIEVKLHQRAKVSFLRWYGHTKK